MTRERSLALPKSYRRRSHLPAPEPSYTLLIQSVTSPFHPKPAAGVPGGFRFSEFSGICLSSPSLPPWPGPSHCRVSASLTRSLTHSPSSCFLQPTTQQRRVAAGPRTPSGPSRIRTPGPLCRSTARPSLGPPRPSRCWLGPAALASPAGPGALGPPGSFLCSGVNLNASATARDGFDKYFTK